jgi:hypothetical protein
VQTRIELTALFLQTFRKASVSFDDHELLIKGITDLGQEINLLGRIVS